ncbi:MAG: ABC transporter ATP-binding protein [Lachnospiraceae bacterium]|nr:ABC transporter ATP-binding protein [Lachnospiraceae bacterium]
MIETIGLSKRFGDVRAVENVSLQIREQEVFGLVGTNGAGKSTLLRIITGILKQDAGTVLVDSEVVFDNVETKKKFFFIPDDPYFFVNGTAEDMKKYYAEIYPGFDTARFERLLKDFGLDGRRKIAGYSKGMKKQLSILLGLCAGTKYLICDETFDGLDPVMRQGIKSLFAKDMEDRGLTPVLTSHNLRELEDICDHMGLLHQGGILLSEDISSMKLSIQKVQCVFAAGIEADSAMKDLDVLSHNVRGRLHTITARGTREEITAHFGSYPTIFFEILSPSLEEIFITETEVVGYDIKKLILD